MVKLKAQWVDRNEMAKAANVSLRTLLNYKKSGMITAFRMVGKRRVEYNKKEVLQEIGGPMTLPLIKRGTPKAPNPTTTDEQKQSKEQVIKQRPPVIVTVQAPAEQPAPPTVVIIQERQQISSGEKWLQEMEELRKERLKQENENSKKKYDKMTKEGKRWTRPPGFLDPFG